MQDPPLKRWKCCLGSAAFRQLVRCTFSSAKLTEIAAAIPLAYAGSSSFGFVILRNLFFA